MEVDRMSGDRTKELISILMESSLYMTLSVKERHALLVRLEKSYLIVSESGHIESDTGYDAR
jgi:hypothetical protein